VIRTPSEYDSSDLVVVSRIISNGLKNKFLSLEFIDIALVV